jgi:putative transposase
MPYEFRDMSPEERAAVVASRRERGYPLHAPPHLHRETGWYFVTAVNFQHEPVMYAPERRDEFERRLLDAFHSIGTDIGGWVVLPNHYHILVGASSLDSVSAVLRSLHGTTSHEWNLADKRTGQRRMWYKFTARRIRGERHYYQSLNYIHLNPIKHRYVSDPYVWLWSSVDLYFETRGRDWLRAIWADHPVGRFGSGWDD